jgi:VanZ family protein
MRMIGLGLGWGWAAAIVWLSLTPSPPEVDIAYGDKLGHFGAYGLLMFWFALVYAQRRTRILYAIGFVALGVGLEAVQGQLGYRTYEVFDMYANTLGVLLGWAAALVLKKILLR